VRMRNRLRRSMGTKASPKSGLGMRSIND
jgi:hypothetical protein